MGLGKSVRFKVGDATISQRLQNEVVLLDLATQEYFGLDELGSQIWELILEGNDVDSVLSRILAAYDVTENTAREDLNQLILQLCVSGLLTPVMESGELAAGGEPSLSPQWFDRGTIGGFMEDLGANNKTEYDANDANIRLRLYYPPKLRRLGPVHVLVQSSSNPGNDTCGCNSGCS